MQQRIARVTTPAGLEVAYAVAGSGRPLVLVGGWLSHLELSWGMPEERSFLERLARGRTLVRYDRVGCGLSPATATAPTLASELDQLGAVIAAVGPGPVDLVGASLGAPVAAAWAAAHPGAVRRLVLYGGWVTGSEIAAPEVRDHVLGLVASHWGLGADVLTDIFAPDAPAAARSDFARYQRASSPAATAGALLAMGYGLDVRDVLPRVAVPTLVVHRAQDRAAPLAQAEALAAGIPGARLEVLPGRSHLPSTGDVDALVGVIRRFLGLRVDRGTASLTPRQREVAALVSAGATNREIAQRLGIDERSAEGHLERIRLRLGVRSRAQVAAWWAARN